MSGGVQECESQPGNEKSTGSTPTTVNAAPFTCATDPIADGLAPKERRQSESLRITTWVWPGSLASAWKSEPSCGEIPRVEKKSGVTETSFTRSAKCPGAASS